VDVPKPGEPGGDAPTRLVLIRHGESHANAASELGGHDGCTGLSTAGRAQVAALRDRLLASGALADATVLLTSRISRAIQTAQLLAPAIGNGRLAARQTCDLCEIHWGALDGKPASSLRDDQSIFERVSQGGESWLGFMRRTRKYFATIGTAYVGRTVVAVTHSGVVKSSMYAFGHLEGEDVVELEADYTGITIWASRNGKQPWRLWTYNDHAHLETCRTFSPAANRMQEP
jgi:2,3-bisphosphoglycerate-dependent phosphoglycerate mutase